MDTEPAGEGFCTVECCNFSTPDPDYCTDMGSGDEECLVGQTTDGITFDPPFHCIIKCVTGEDCPENTLCTDIGGVDVCYGIAE